MDPVNKKKTTMRFPADKRLLCTILQNLQQHRKAESVKAKPVALKRFNVKAALQAAASQESCLLSEGSDRQALCSLHTWDCSWLHMIAAARNALKRTELKDRHPPPPKTPSSQRVSGLTYQGEADEQNHTEKSNLSSKTLQRQNRSF